MSLNARQLAVRTAAQLAGDPPPVVCPCGSEEWLAVPACAWTCCACGARVSDGLGFRVVWMSIRSGSLRSVYRLLER